jgi:transposase-like zinc-binding protein
MGCVAPVYRPRDAEYTVLHQVIAEHLEAFLGVVAEPGDGAGLPQFVEREFREFLLCGVYEAGVARFQCEGCAREHLVPFSCKGRGFCPSCGGRRMTERAAHLVDEVLPWVPVRQWVLMVPYRLRYQMAWNRGLSRAVLGVCRLCREGGGSRTGRPPSKGAKVGFALSDVIPGRDSLLEDRAGHQRRRGGPHERAEGLRACPTGASPPRRTLDSVIVAAAISYDRRRAE